MEVFIIIVVFILLLVIANGSNKKAVKQPQSEPVVKTEPEEDNKMAGKSKERELIESLIANLKITVGTTATDESVIDVTNGAYKLPKSEVATTTTVPFWPHFYVYSFNDLQRANPQQKQFYQQFKTAFLNREYYDLQGNTNYAFILLFDFLNEYDKHHSIEVLVDQLKELGNNYPKTRTYCKSNLIQKMREKSDYAGILRIDSYPELQSQNYSTGYVYEYVNFGTKLKTKLDLNAEQEALVNKLSDPFNNFCNIEFCLLQTIRLYLLVIEELNNQLGEQSSSLPKEIEAIADIVTTKFFKYKPGSYNYKYAVETTSNDVYRLLFKHAENALREHYNHKRKLNTDFNYGAEVKIEFEQRIETKLPALFAKILHKVEMPDEVTEIALNEQNTSRWKNTFEIIKKSYTSNPVKYFESVLELGKLNRTNPSIENIFFEASKCIAKFNKEISLKLFIHYLYHDLKSSSFDNKQLTKTVQKALFTSNEQLHDFERIISDLMREKDLEKAVLSVSQIYKPKRRKIKLDVDAITEVRQKHSSTVEILDEILNDDYEDETTSIHSEEVNSEEVKIEIVHKIEVAPPPQIKGMMDLNLNSVQMELLDMFLKHSFLVPAEEVDGFARSKGLFKNQLIDSINEICYENLDDLLIEEEEDSYIINEQYYQRIVLS